MMFDPIQLRRQLHQIPEIAFNEHRTKSLLMSYLQEMDAIKIHEFANSPGILVEYSHGEGSYKLFRADMDALPVTEQTGCDFASKSPGMMHACGHDVHMAILMGLIAQVVNTRPEKNLLFLFQPAEEGKGGAETILAEGLIQRFEIESAYALHVNPHLGLNQVSTKAGIFFAIPQEFDVCFHGKSAHVAFPEEGRDAMAGGMEFYQRMKRECHQYSLEERLIFHVGKLQSGVIRNVIADHCKLEGTHRTLTKTMRDRVNAAIKQQAADSARDLGLEVEVDFLCSYDAVVNDESLYLSFIKTCQQLGVELIPSPVYMTGEDFGFFTSLYPGLLFWLGANDDSHDLHSGSFLPDDACIPIGIRIFFGLI